MVPLMHESLDPAAGLWHIRATSRVAGFVPAVRFSDLRGRPMKVRNSLKSLRGRHRDNQLVRRKGRVYIINKTQKRYKARQG